MGTVYIVPASPKISPRQRALLRALGVDEWCYVGSRTGWRLELERALDGAGVWRSISAELDATSRQLRQPFLESMAVLAARNASPSWWGTRLANKNPYTSSLFLDCCLLKVALGLCTTPSRGGRLLVVEDATVLERLAALTRDLGATVRVFGPPRRLPRVVRDHAATARYWGWLWTTYVRRRAVLKRAGLLSAPPFEGEDTALIITWVGRRNITEDGRYTDPNVGDALLQSLRRAGYRLAFLTNVLGDFTFETAVERLRSTGETCLFREGLLEPADVAGAIARSASYRPHLPRPITLDGLDITALVEAQLRRDRGEMADNLSYRNLIRRMAGARVRPRLVFHNMEGHSWERILAHTVREHLPRTRVIAINSGTFAPLWLSVHGIAAELARVPLPDRIITNGPLMATVLQSAGYPAERLTAGADFRRTYLWEQPALARRTGPGQPTRVLVATEIGIDQSIELVDKVLRAFADRPGYAVTVKSHPMVPTGQLTAALAARSRASNVRFSEKPIADLLREADVLLYTQTVVCLEALRFGVFPVFVRAEGAVNLDQLEYAPDCRRIATSPDEIRTEVDAVARLSLEAWRHWNDWAQTALAAHLGPVTGDVLDRCFRFTAPAATASME